PELTGPTRPGATEPSGTTGSAAAGTPGTTGPGAPAPPEPPDAPAWTALDLPGTAAGLGRARRHASYCVNAGLALLAAALTVVVASASASAEREAPGSQDGRQLLGGGGRG
ncbi:hypothetical protein H5I60_33685, partial [Streptomyces griseolus]|nr:hypothetical protein [Streptomyces griseolus]